MPSLLLALFGQLAAAVGVILVGSRPRYPQQVSYRGMLRLMFQSACSLHC